MGHTLVDASSGSGSVLIVNPNAEVVVLPGYTLIGKLVPVAAISVAMEDPGLPNDGPATLPVYLEEIVGGSHPSLGDAGRQLLRDLLFRYSHVFPGARGASYRPDYGSSTWYHYNRRPASSLRPTTVGPCRTQKGTDMCAGDVEPSDSPWASPRCFSNQERRINAFLCRLS